MDPVKKTQEMSLMLKMMTGPSIGIALCLTEHMASTIAVRDGDCRRGGKGIHATGGGAGR